MRKCKLALLFLIIMLTGCSITNSTSTSKSEVVQHPFGGGDIQPVSTSSRRNSSSYTIDSIHAFDVVSLFQKQGLPIGTYEEYTKDSDPNGLLGQSNSYIEKISFADTRLQAESDYASQPLGGTIEIFQTEEDAKARYTYLRNVTASSVQNMYVYQHKTILLRLEKRLSASQAQEYEQVLIQLENGAYQ